MHEAKAQSSTQIPPPQFFSGGHPEFEGWHKSQRYIEEQTARITKRPGFGPGRFGLLKTDY